MKSMTPAVLAFVAVVSVAALVGAFALAGRETSAPSLANVSVVDGKQIVDIQAKGGYSPRETAAQANMPTVLRIKTSGTFDCSASLTIPSLGYRTELPPSGVTLVDVPPQAAGSTLRGSCSMGMYSFAVRFS